MAATSHGTPARVQCRRSSLTSVYGMLRHRDEGDSLIVGAGIDPSAAAACTPQGIAEVQALADRTTSEQLRSGSGDGSGPSVQVGSPAPWDPDLMLLEPRPSLLSMGGKRVKAVFAPFGVGADGGVTTVK